MPAEAVPEAPMGRHRTAAGGDGRRCPEFPWADRSRMRRGFRAAAAAIIGPGVPEMRLERAASVAGDGVAGGSRRQAERRGRCGRDVQWLQEAV